ncbi:hypothetical protein DICSQDRAFT_138729 [Dichomitus squalens LYAD-421 SS1]|uniref:Uncharacterized protein n=1 Tax=Dichomitus squalens (strain LYAD-421) TaxID=732165 RepID=R7SSH1_DICSQ|nr:uncharacterized protein DICSQDRAFT_138729 [Dichomitus squalens LYAD-421 SS1]EJF59139.1 hypothetical protein DICSQDRAFT_138729 [Dichomitus squalens LYAD-421 SS1]
MHAHKAPVEPRLPNNRVRPWSVRMRTNVPVGSFVDVPPHSGQQPPPHDKCGMLLT